MVKYIARFNWTSMRAGPSGTPTRGRDFGKGATFKDTAPGKSKSAPLLSQVGDFEGTIIGIKLAVRLQDKYPRRPTFRSYQKIVSVSRKSSTHRCAYQYEVLDVAPNAGAKPPKILVLDYTHCLKWLSYTSLTWRKFFWVVKTVQNWKIIEKFVFVKGRQSAKGRQKTALEFRLFLGQNDR